LLQTTFVISGVLIAAAPVWTQSANAVVFRGGTNAVMLQVSVTAGKGEHVDDLTAENFTVLEDGAPQTISHFSKADDPLALSLLLDTSASMDESIGLAQRAAIQFTGRLRASDVAEVVAFNNQVKVLQPFTANPRELDFAIRQASVSGTTALYSALFTALDQLATLRATQGFNRRAIVLLSDGEDTSSQIGFDEVFDLARCSGVSIYPIGLGIRPKLDIRTPNPAPDILQRFAKATGGRAIFVDRADQLSRVYSQVADELASQYAIAYRPTTSQDGKWHDITVRVDRRNVDARTRAGYVAQ
jgi:Ca-activated chloride channel family protein